MTNPTGQAGKRAIYPAYRPSGMDWVGDVPEHWTVRRLKYTASINDAALPETTDPDYEFVYVDIGSVDAAKGIMATETYRFEEAPSRARRIVRDGDTIVSTVRTYLRAIARIRDPDDNLVVSTGFAVIRPRKLDAGYLSYVLRAPFFVETVVSRSTGVSYPAINANEVGNIGVTLPPLDEQRAIAAFLDRETERIDGLIEKKQQQIELLREKRSALISHAVTKGLDPGVAMKDSGVGWAGGVPVHWRVVRLRRVGVVDQGCTFPQSIQGHSEGRTPWYKVSDMNREGNDIVMFDAENYVDPEVTQEVGAALFPAGTVIFPRVGAALLTNKRRLLSRPAITDDNVYGFIPRRISSRFSFYVLSLIDFASLCSPGLVPTVTIPAVKDIEIPLPPSDEQEKVVDFLDSQTCKIDALASKVHDGISVLYEHRTALISAAVTGKIDVRKEVS